MNIKSLKQTSELFPDQWECQLHDNRYLYVHCKNNFLSYGIGGSIDEAVENSDHNGYIQFHPMCGYGAILSITTEQMIPMITALMAMNSKVQEIIEDRKINETL